MDAELLAHDVGKRYGAEYLRCFDTLMAETRTAVQKGQLDPWAAGES